MTHKIFYFILGLLFSTLILAACALAPEVSAQYDPNEIRFSGERAFAIEEELVTRHTNRVSGSEESRLAVKWLHDQLVDTGWNCEMDH